jgi:hypothetical protein
MYTEKRSMYVVMTRHRHTAEFWEQRKNDPNFDNGFVAKDLVEQAKNAMVRTDNDESRDDDGFFSDSD